MENEPTNPWSRATWLKANEPLSPTSRPQNAATTIAPEIVVLPYRLGAMKLFLGIAFSGGCTMFLAHLARTNDRGLILEEIIHLSPKAATIFLWCMTYLSGGFALTLFYGTLWAITGRQIELHDDIIVLPGLLNAFASHRLLAREISSFALRHYKHYQYMTLWHDGRLFTINSHWLPAQGDMETIVKWLEQRCHHLPHRFSRGD